MEKRIVENVLAAALETGGDFSELYLEDTEQNSVSMVDGKIENASYKRISGAGVRIFSDKRCIYAYTSKTDEASLIATARAAAAALNGSRGASPSPITVTREYSKAPDIPYDTVRNADRIAVVREMSDAAKAYSPEITQVTAGYADVDQRVLIANSNGVWATDRRPRSRVNVTAVAMSGGEAQTGYEAPGRGQGFEWLRQTDVAAFGKGAAATAVTMLHAPQCPAGAVPVVIDGGFGGVILHEACVHSLEATSVAKGNSEFCGKLGQRIGSERVTAVDDGTLEGEWGTLHFDDEGNPTRRNVLIENGILKSYLVDSFNARLMDGHPITGSARRQSYTFAPTSRMTNTFFAPGTDDGEEMIKTMGTGLFAAKMGGGSVNPLTGEFNFAVLEGYWVKDGKIFSPVRGATLIGLGRDILLRVDRVGERMWMAQGMCGSLSGSIPTNVGQPRIRVSEITVGGKGGAL